jgi:enterochelin esterase-like enzyme
MFDLRKQSKLLGFIVSLCFSVMIIQISIAAGTVEYHVIQSKLVGEMELTVYLPPGYEASQLAYPVLYIHHGSADSVPKKNRAVFGGYIGSVPGFVPIQDIADDMINKGQISPMILIGPAINNFITVDADDVWAKYFFQEIEPYVREHFSTLTDRAYRGTLGFSKGGNDGPLLAFKRPDLFSAVGISAGATWFDLDKATANYNPLAYPMRFWVWHGSKDPVVSLQYSEKFVELLKKKGLDYVFKVVDTDIHDECLSPSTISEALAYFSKVLGSPQVAVSSHDRLSTAWGEIKNK